MSAPMPEFTCDDDGDWCIEWYASPQCVLTVTLGCTDVRFAAATGHGITSSATWEIGTEPPASFFAAYRAVVLGER